MTDNSAPIVSLIGGTGFLGQHVARALLQAGYRVHIYSRNPEKAQQMKTLGTMGQLQLLRGSIRSHKTLERATNNVYAVINLVGLLYESGDQTFKEVHTNAVKKLAHLATMKDIEKCIHVSGLGVDQAMQSRYAQTKLAGEEVLLDEFPHATIMRPSIIFGPEDSFFNRFEYMSRYLPCLPLVGDGHTGFQPVYVKDVAIAIVSALQKKECEGKTYELGGPKTYSFKELIAFILRITGRHRALIPLPFPIAKMQARMFELLPKPLLTRDQVELLRTNNVVKDKKHGFKAFDIEPIAIEDVVPGYLRR